MDVQTEPVPPEDVRVLMADGREIPVECRYVGRDERGTHLWVAVCPLRGEPAEVRAAMIPPFTAIGLAFEGDDECE